MPNCNPLFLGILLTLLISGPAIGAKVPQGLIDANLPGCKMNLKMKLDPNAPSDPKREDEYCRCSVAKYWESVPQAEYDAFVKEQSAGVFNGPGNTALQKKMKERMTAASQTCN